ncbi:MAG: GAP family protein [Nocardioides sp.]
MGLILPLLFLGLMASLSPATIVVFVLVLGTARARVNAVGFLFGWGLSLTFVFAASYALAASDASETEGGRTSVAVLEILLGFTLLVFAARLWRRGQTAPASTVPSRWGADRIMGHMQGLTPVGAAVVGVLKQPWAITTAAALVVVHNHTTGLKVAIAFVLFTVASTATVGLMFLYYARYPGEAQAQLAALRDRVVAAGPAMGGVAGMLVGGFLMIDGLITIT